MNEILNVFFTLLASRRKNLVLITHINLKQNRFYIGRRLAVNFVLFMSVIFKDGYEMFCCVVM